MPRIETIVYVGTPLSFFAVVLFVDELLAPRALGGLLILAIGFNILGIQRLRIGNMLPAIFVPLLYNLVVNWWRAGM